MKTLSQEEIDALLKESKLDMSADKPENQFGELDEPRVGMSCYLNEAKVRLPALSHIACSEPILLSWTRYWPIASFSLHCCSLRCRASEASSSSGGWLLQFSKR